MFLAILALTPYSVTKLTTFKPQIRMIPPLDDVRSRSLSEID